MTIEHIFISPEGGAPQQSCERITLKAGAGIVGDRNFGKLDYPGRNLTLVEAEEIEHFCAQHGRVPELNRTRRNLVTRGVRLNDLVGQTFNIGAVQVRGVELCEPCEMIGATYANETLTAAAAVRAWVGRAGLRVDVLSDGEVRLGDRISLPQQAAA